MKIYVALLRGINVGGFKKIRMADLKGHLEQLGWEGIQTYIQSGNIIFRNTDEDPFHLAQAIKQKLQDKYGFEVPTLVFNSRKLMDIIHNNPFTRDPETVYDRLYVTFLFSAPRADLVRKLQVQEQTNEQFIVGGEIIYLYYPNGYGKAVMDNNAFEKALQLEATTRNWKTVNKLYEMTLS